MANPRTANRPLANNDLTIKQVLLSMLLPICMILFGTMMIDWKYLFLLPIPLILCLGYSLSKRYTWLCHLILGITNAICPVAGWAIFSTWYDWKLLLMGGIVCFWTMGFELIYSMQDIEYDRANNMYSIPSVFGIQFAHRLSLLCHLIMSVLFIILIIVLKLGFAFFIGFLIGLFILLYEHSLVTKNGVENPTLAFNLNQIFSLQLMAFGILEKIF